MLMLMLRTHFSVRLCVLLFVLSFSTNMLAQFHPDSPPDPETPTGPPAPVPQYLLTVRALPAEGGTVSGGGRSYETGTSVKVKTTRNANYTFLYWENRHGEVLVEVDNAYFYGEDVLIPWPCYRLGVDDPQKAVQEWNISPNPTTGRLTVTGGNDNGETVRLEVIDATGRVLLNATGLSVDLAPLGTGVYYIRIITDNTVKVKKVVKN